MDLDVAFAWTMMVTSSVSLRIIARTDLEVVAGWCVRLVRQYFYHLKREDLQHELSGTEEGTEVVQGHCGSYLLDGGCNRFVATLSRQHR